MNNREKILHLHENRYILIHQLETIVNEDINENEEFKLGEEIDLFADKIMELITENFDELEFDFIMEQLANLGQCPNLLNDDNGHWAITGDGYQNVVIGDEPSDVETHFFIEAKEWKNTPKEALKDYLNSDEE